MSALRPWQWPWYPFIAVPMPALLLWAVDPVAVDFVDVVIHVAIALVTAAVLVAVYARFLGVWRGALGAAIAGVFLFSTENALLTALLIAIITVILWRLPPSASPTRKVTLTTYANGLVLTFALTTVFPAARRVLRENDALPAPSPVSITADTRPDVWWILLDGHARGDWLRARFGVEDRLGPGLKARGFQVADTARANYCQTLYAVASTLNLDYVQARAGEQRATRRMMFELIGDSAVAATFRKLGYRTVFWPGGYPLLNPHLDERERPLLMPTEYHLLRLSRWLPIAAWQSLTGHPLSAELRRDFVGKTLGRITPATGTPTFNFVHLLSPHPPFVTDEHGGIATTGGSERIADASHWEAANPESNYRTGYARQAAWVDGEILAAVDRLIAGTNRPAVIIVSSDHGSGLGLDWDDPKGEALHERLSSVWAVRLPQPATTQPPMTISPVNTFRYVFDEAFGTKLGLLPDRSYRHSWQEPDVMTDVTDEVRGPP